eukprot:1190558-Prorocentrum_minimum.AAC.3
MLSSLTKDHGLQCSQEDEDEVQYHTFSSMMNELKFSDGFYSSLSMVSRCIADRQYTKTIVTKVPPLHFPGMSGQVLVSELGDETFIIAAIMAMRHPRAIVLAGALSALWIMTVRIICTPLKHLGRLLICYLTVARDCFLSLKGIPICARD